MEEKPWLLVWIFEGIGVYKGAPKSGRGWWGTWKVGSQSGKPLFFSLGSLSTWEQMTPVTPNCLAGHTPLCSFLHCHLYLNSLVIALVRILEGYIFKINKVLKRIVFLFVFVFCFLPCCTACRILVLWSGIEPVPSAVEVRSLNHWTAREVPRIVLYLQKSCKDCSEDSRILPHPVSSIVTSCICHN